MVIPNSIITIENGRYRSSGLGDSFIGSFSGNEELTKVILGNSLKNIGDYAFFGGSQFLEIIIPDSVTKIGDYAFSTSYTRVEGKLTKVTFGKGLQTIGEDAFRGNKITELNFPSSLKEIKKTAFRYNNIQKINFSTGLQTIGEEAFRHNAIAELNLPSSLKEIGGGAFDDNQIQSIAIPNGVTSISNYIFDYPSRHIGTFANNPLTTVVIPASLANGEISGQYFNERDSPTFGNISGSTINRITIPVRMDERTLRGIFEEAFVNFWISQNKAGGTYVKRGPIWTKE